MTNTTTPYRRTRDRLQAPRPATCPIDHGVDRRCLWAAGHPGPCLLSRAGGFGERHAGRPRLTDLDKGTEQPRSTT